MKKHILYFVLCTLSLGTLVGCGKQSKNAETKTDTVVVVEEVLVQTGNTEGAYFTDFTGVTPEGEELSLSDLVGQTDFVLVDFWASWCGPCRRFIPVLKEIYSSMPQGRLQIISCSVDQEEAAWRSALSEEQMPWPQIHEDANHNCADLYNVQFIPHTVLIDQEGKIVAVNPEEPELEEFLLY